MKYLFSTLLLICVVIELNALDACVPIEIPEVIVIGAGAAGIAAATRLDKHGISVKVFEAEPRIGGRVRSVHFGDAKVELGAEFCHGEKGNLVYEMMKDTGILKHSKNYNQIYSSDRSKISKQFGKQLLEMILKVYSIKPSNATINDSLGAYYTKNYLNAVHEKYTRKYHPKELRLSLMALDLMERIVGSDYSAPSWFQISAMYDVVEYEGDLYINFNGKGYSSVLDVLMQDFNTTDKLFTNKRVTKIGCSETHSPRSDRICVTADNIEYSVQHVIFTPSLGVLKNYHDTLFSPALLNCEKLNAIENLGYGAVLKVMLFYSKIWWPTTTFTGFNFIWSYEDRDSLVIDFPAGPQKDGKSWLSNLVGAFKVGHNSNPHVLCAWFVGEFIPAIENLNDDVLIDGITFAFEKFVGHLHEVQRPDKILRPKWYSNENFRGAYSYQTMESGKMMPAANEILAEPSLINGVPRLLFAGEVTNLKNFGTVHGAIESGFREADRLIKILESSSKKRN